MFPEQDKKWNTYRFYKQKQVNELFIWSFFFKFSKQLVTYNVFLFPERETFEYLL